MDERFLLGNETAFRLYTDYAQDMPIIDYHSHLNPQEIWEDKRFGNIAEVWLNGDHYKWRAMRANGVEERLITGRQDVTDFERFAAWCATVPALPGNPLYHWSHLELRRIFGITEEINEGSAAAIWEKANAKLQSEELTVRAIIRGARVETICTTDDPADSLEYHLKLGKEADLGFRVLPTFRPDRALELARTAFVPWLRRLSEASGYSILTYPQLLQALEERILFFHQAGGRISDHALDYVPYAEATLEEASTIFAKAVSGSSVSLEEEQKYKTFTLLFLGKIYKRQGWVVQYHINAHRNNNSLMEGRLGPDTGYDSIHDHRLAYPLVRLLDALDNNDALPKTILYSLNAKDNDVLASIAGSFQGEGIPGKIQLGSAWWFNDTKSGMRAQLESLGNIGVLGRFVGMLTDSRSFLSFPRHEYFRRVLCSLIGEWVEQGELPDNRSWLGDTIRNISYWNAQHYFGFGGKE